MYKTNYVEIKNSNMIACVDFNYVEALSESINMLNIFKNDLTQRSLLLEYIDLNTGRFNYGVFRATQLSNLTNQQIMDMLIKNILDKRYVNHIMKLLNISSEYKYRHIPFRKVTKKELNVYLANMLEFQKLPHMLNMIAVPFVDGNYIKEMLSK